LFLLKETIKTKLNLEMAATEEMLEIAKKILPDYVTLVPEKREEVTTEGGLDLKSNVQYLKKAVGNLKDSNIEVSAFIDPLGEQINYSKEIGFDFIELHTGKYAELSGSEQYKELQRIIESTHLANDLGLVVNAGHGLNYNNVKKIASIGIGCKRWITINGFSINIDCELENFNKIVPCGIENCLMANMIDYNKNLNIKEVKRIVKKIIQEEFNFDFVSK